ncbi:MAG: hypothetical protein KBD83_01010 [Gammaproteobacteria bacterium]|nr:hypothetical protein [Gammaproteobacteria bacterium]
MKSLQNHIERTYGPKERLRKKIAEETLQLEERSQDLHRSHDKIKHLENSDASISAEIAQLKTAINGLDRKSSERTSEDLHRANNQGQKTRKQLQSISHKLHHENTQLESDLRLIQEKYQDVQVQYESRQRKYQSTIASTHKFSENRAELTERIQDAERQLTALFGNLRKPVRGTLFESSLLQPPLDAAGSKLKLDFYNSSKCKKSPS